MASTAPITTSATATTATGPVTALTTTFTPPAKCTEQSLMFTMLSAPNYEVWANEPMPVSSSTVTECYPSEWIGAYQTANTSSIVPAMSPLVCPLSWETVMTAPGNYIACCPPGFRRTDPKTTVDGYRPFYGGTCYSELPSGSAVRVTQYNNLSISATVTFTASSQNVGLYAHPIDGYAYQAQETIFVSSNATSLSPSSSSSSSSLATPTSTPTPNSSKTLSNGAIAGIVIGSLAEGGVGEWESCWCCGIGGGEGGGGGGRDGKVGVGV
ncbi:hypothetical protein SMMN14_05632 [Sphaerulina musiva]